MKKNSRQVSSIFASKQPHFGGAQVEQVYVYHLDFHPSFYLLKRQKKSLYKSGPNCLCRLLFHIVIQPPCAIATSEKQAPYYKS